MSPAASALSRSRTTNQMQTKGIMDSTVLTPARTMPKIVR